MENSSKYMPSYPEKVYETPKSSQKLNKAPVDFGALENWQMLDNENAAISNDGKYCMYVILNRPIGSGTLIVQDLSGAWKKELIGIVKGFFSIDNKEFIFQDGNSLSFLKLGTDEIQKIPDVTNYQTKGVWLFYQMKNGDLVVRDLGSDLDKKITHVSSFRPSETGSNLFVEKNEIKNGKPIRMLEWQQLNSGKVDTIWNSSKGVDLINYAIDKSENQMVLLLRDGFNKHNSIWYFNLTMRRPISLIDSNLQGTLERLELVNKSPEFTQNGKYVCFYLTRPTPISTNQSSSKVDIWNYKDSILQSTQLQKVETPVVMAAVELNNLSSRFSFPITKILDFGEHFLFGPSQSPGDYVVVSRTYGDQYWKSGATYTLVCLRDGSRKMITTNAKNLSNGSWFNPDGNILLIFENGQYYSVSAEKGTKNCISCAVNTTWGLTAPFHRGYGFENSIPLNIAGWISETRMIAYDYYDIWELDITGDKKPICLTYNLGRRENIIFRIIGNKTNFKERDKLLVSAFNPSNKFNSIFEIPIKSNKMATISKLEPITIYYGADPTAGTTFFDRSLFIPIKAKNSNTWLVQRQSAVEAPNFYYTKDFQRYIRISDLQAQKVYNWLTVELLNWKRPDGSVGQGILYKPENFDSTKKYPVLIDFYEVKSGRLHQFPVPNYAKSTHVPIAWMVSHGYLVFSPDMRLIKNKEVESVCDNIVSAAQSLSLLPYVDSSKMGISGFSWGGSQANWLITQTDLFAAAATGGAQADPISAALQISGSSGKSELNSIDGSESSFGVSIWENPSKWLNVSPILRADKISTPVLMMNNFRDRWWHHATELYVAMRRLEKRIWMLQYDQGGHVVWGPPYPDAKDFTIRYTQFFDHYLKSAPAPIWMTQGIPARLKGVITGYDYDPANSCGKDCKVCKQWNEKFKKDSAACWKEINERKEKEHWQ